MMRPRSVFGLLFAPVHLRRTLIIALVIGTWLTAFNQADVLLSSGWTWALGLKVFLNYLTPFVVANLGLLSHCEDRTGSSPV